MSRNSPYLLWLSSGNTVYTGLDQVSWYWASSSVNAIQPNKWQFIAMVYDGTSRRIYVDGAQSGAADTQISGNINSTGSGVIAIGEDNCCGERYAFNGLIDEVRIYSNALSTSSIQELYAEGELKHGLSLKF